MIIVDLIMGCLMVLAGKDLFWLCIGVIGFLMGVQFAQWINFPDQGTAIACSVGLGILGAILAISFEWIMVVVGVGFLGGGYLLMNLFPNTTQELHTWPIFILGGIIGTCLTVIIFDGMLIIITSLVGGMLIANAFAGNIQLHDLIFLGTAILGMMVQYFAGR